MSLSFKVPVCISVHPEQLARLDQIAADLDRSRSWVASRALDAFLAVTDFTPSLAVGADAQAEPRGTGGCPPLVPPLAPSGETPMPDVSETSKDVNASRGLHHAHLVRTIGAAQRQAAEASAGREAALARSAQYIGKMIKPQ
jgi:hypothetical protein